MANMQERESGIPRRSGTKYMYAESEQSAIVSMCEFKDRLYLATKDGIYRLDDEKFVQLKILNKDFKEDPLVCCENCATKDTCNVSTHGCVKFKEEENGN